MKSSETRHSLLVRVRDPADREAWYEFTEIYRPAIRRVALARGLQDADADDLTQHVLVAVSGAIERWQADPGRAKFRTWLRRITENAVLNALTRGSPDRGSGDSAVQALLNQRVSSDGPDSDLLQFEYRRELFRWAARQIRDEFQPSTWDAFWQTAVEDRDVIEVAAALDKNRGSIYAARSRIMRRLQERIAEFESEE